MRFEHWRYTLPLRLKSIFIRSRVERELEEELRFHLELKIDEGIAEGLSPEEARRRAMRAMDGLEQKKEEMRDARRIHWLTDFVDDLRFALRGLRRTPGIAALVVVTLALGIGMTATPFSMLDALIFRPYPVPHAGNVVTLVGTSHDTQYDPFSYREYLDLRDETTELRRGDRQHHRRRRRLQLPTPQRCPRSEAACWSPGTTSRVLGVEPELGRGFRADEDLVPGRDAVAVLASGFWKRELAGDPSIVGRKIRLNGTEFTVIGVAPETFSGNDASSPSPTSTFRWRWRGSSRPIRGRASSRTATTAS